MLVHRRALTNGEVHRPDNASGSRSCRSASCAPVVAGHIGDIDWYSFVHERRDRVPPAALDRRARHERRSGRGLGALRVRQPSGRWPMPATAEPHGPGLCDGDPAVAGADGARERAASTNRLLRPHGEQRLLPADPERHLAPRPRRGRSRRRSTRSGSFVQYVEDIERTSAGADEEPPRQGGPGGFSDDEVFGEIQRRRGAEPAAKPSRSSRPSSRP